MASVTSLPVQHTTRMVASPSLAQVLQSDPVKRLFNQPNIVIHAIPRNNSPTAFRVIAPKSNKEKKTKINGEYNLQKPEVSIQVIDSSSNKVHEEENLLPSKNNGKSEILLVPIIRKRKVCGHFEPCESLTCNITVQQYEDDEGITPLVSFNIGDDEIDAVVTKHCASQNCDALSIDHDRCRKASVYLYRCDKCIMCEICGNTFQNRKSHLNHKKCRRKNVYQHNIATPSEIFKFRMREKELQILEAARLKRSCDYLDPVTGFSRTMEALKKNNELIIIPKMPPPSSEILKFNFSPLITHNNKHNNSNSNNINFNNNVKNSQESKKITADTNKELTTEMISNIIMSCRNSIENSKKCEQSNSLPQKHIKLSDHLNGATVNIQNTSTTLNQPSINVRELHLPSSIGLASGNKTTVSPPLNISNVNLTPFITGNQANNSEEPLKIVIDEVVSTADPKSQPSLLHQKHGVPKFCVVPDNTATLDTPLVPKIRKACQKKLLKKTDQIINSGKLRPLQPALIVDARNMDKKLNNIQLTKKQKVRKKNVRSRKKLPKKGKYKCTYCPKRFSSTDYCKIHISKHENNPGFFCRLCEKGFLNKYTMKKHIDADHNVGEVRCEMCDCILTTTQELLNHMKNPEIKKVQKCSECQEPFDTCNNLDIHMRKEHGFVICSLCKRQITKSKIKKHLMLEHSISKNRTDTKFDKLSYSPGANDKVCEAGLVNQVEVQMKTTAKVELKENEVESDCLARNRSVRRRSSKEIFTCTVCGRRFQSEKFYQIHLANNPMKFTPCPDCGRKFHRKSEYTEHSKICNWSNGKPVISTNSEKKRRLRLPPEESALKIDSDNINAKTEDSIDQNHDTIMQSDQQCKKLKLEEKIVQNADESIVKSTIKIKIVNGLNQESNDCSKMLSVIKSENNVTESDNVSIVKEHNEVLLLNAKQAQKESNQSAVFDKASVITSIIQDHNYQALK